MATGEKRFNSGEREVSKSDFTPVPPGTWTGKLVGSKAEIRKKKDEPSAVPYISVPFEVIGSALKEGQKNRMVYHRFFLSTTPNEGGRVMVDNQEQIVAFGKASGLALDAGIMEVTDPKGKEIEILNPNDVLTYLKENDGQLVQLHTKLEEKFGGGGQDARIVRFEPPNAA